MMQTQEFIVSHLDRKYAPYNMIQYVAIPPRIEPLRKRPFPISAQLALMNQFHTLLEANVNTLELDSDFLEENCYFHSEARSTAYRCFDTMSLANMYSYPHLPLGTIDLEKSHF